MGGMELMEAPEVFYIEDTEDFDRETREAYEEYAEMQIADDEDARYLEHLED